ncbi:MAG: DHA2 family efflux MFS transporter permease subunit [Aquisalimonadaceae bacterium]
MTSSTELLSERYGPAYKWLATITVIVGSLSMALSSTVVNVAVPDVMSAFDIPQSKAHWLATGFLAAMTAFMLLSAWALHTFGMRLAYGGGMVIFIVASVAGGLSPTEDLVILSRVVQGAMAGIIQPLAMVMIFHIFPPRQRGLGLGLYGLGAMLGPAIGPAMGGVLVDVFNWRAVFFLPVPTCLISLVLGFYFAPGRDAGTTRMRFDWLGFGLLSLFLLSLLWALSNGQRLGWQTPLIIGLLAVATATAVAFVYWELRARQPLLNVRIFTVPGFAAGSIISFVFGAGIFGSTYLIPLFVQEIQGFTPTAAGMLLLPAGLLMAMMFPLGGHISDRLSPFVPIGVGTVLFAVSCYILSLADVNTMLGVLVFWVIVGRIGMGLGFTPINAGALRILDYSQVSQGAGAVSFARQIGGALGVNLLSLILDRRTLYHARAMPDEEITQPLQLLGQTIDLQAYTRGFQDSFLVLGLLFMLALIPAWIMGRYMGGGKSAARVSSDQDGA